MITLVSIFLYAIAMAAFWISGIGLGNNENKYRNTERGGVIIGIVALIFFVLAATVQVFG